MLSRQILHKSLLLTKAQLTASQRLFTSKVYPNAQEVSSYSELHFFPYQNLTDWLSLGHQGYSKRRYFVRGRIRLVRHPWKTDRLTQASRAERLSCGFEQLRSWRLGSRPAAQEQANQEDDIVVCWREQRVRKAISIGRARVGAGTSRHIGREVESRRRRHSCLLHPHWLGHPCWGGWVPTSVWPQGP